MSLNTKKEYNGSRNRKPDLNSLVFGKMPPQAPDLEEAVLGACLLEKEAFEDIQELIKTSEVFYVDAHQRIYSAMVRLSSSGRVVDLLTVTDELRKSNELDLIGGAYFLTSLTTSVLSSAHVSSHAAIIIGYFLKREQIRIGGSMINEAYENSGDPYEIMDKAQQALSDIAEQNIRQNYDHIMDVVMDVAAEAEEMKRENRHVLGLQTGLRILDNGIHGLVKSSTIVIGALPSVGKTAFMGQLIINLALNGYPVGLFTLEMSKKEIVKRLLSSISGIPLELIITNKIPADKMKVYNASMQKLASLPIYIDEQPGISIKELRIKTRRMVKKDKVEAIFIDYLQLMGGDSIREENEEQKHSTNSRELKKIGKELNIAVIELSQVNDEYKKRDNKKIMPGDLRGSRAIEQNADVILLLDRKDYQKKGQVPESDVDTIEVEIAKHRNGETFTPQKMTFNKAIQRIVNYVEPSIRFESSDPSAPYKSFRPVASIESSRSAIPASEPITDIIDDLPF